MHVETYCIYYTSSHTYISGCAFSPLYWWFIHNLPTWIFTIKTRGKLTGPNSCLFSVTNRWWLVEGARFIDNFNKRRVEELNTILHMFWMNQFLLWFRGTYLFKLHLMFALSIYFSCIGLYLNLNLSNIFRLCLLFSIHIYFVGQVCTSSINECLYWYLPFLGIVHNLFLYVGKVFNRYVLMYCTYLYVNNYVCDTSNILFCFCTYVLIYSVTVQLIFLASQ